MSILFLLITHYFSLFATTKLEKSLFKKVFFQRLFTSSWGQFDWLTIKLPAWAYSFYGLVSLMGVYGIANYFRTASQKPRAEKLRVTIWIYLASIFLSLVNLIFLNFTFLSAQGRLLFPIISPVCILISIGMNESLAYFSRFLNLKSNRLIACFILFFIVLNLYSLIFTIYPVYH